MATHFILLVVLIVFSKVLNAQVQIVDSENSQAVPYAHVKLVEDNKGLLSDYNGYFELDSTFSASDSVIIYCQGYDPEYTSVEKLKNSQQIQLSPTPQLIEEVQVTQKRGRYKRFKLGVTKKPKKRDFSPLVTGENGTTRAFYIANNLSRPGLLKSTRIFISDFGFPKTHFRLHIYSVSPLAIKPGKELTSSNIIASADTGNEWVEIDLTDERITIPENGCFVGIEWFDLPEVARFRDTLYLKGTIFYTNRPPKDTVIPQILHGNGIVLGSTLKSYQDVKNSLWHKTNVSAEWIKSTMTLFNQNIHFVQFVRDSMPRNFSHFRTKERIGYRIPCIYLETSFPKEKTKLKYEPPKKRKLNRIERVKEDRHTYPQASVNQLLNSLVKAFENDDIIYVLKFLCVYDDAELDYILTNLKDKENDTGVYFSAEEKEKAIAHFHFLLEHLNEDALTKTDNHHFELVVGDSKYQLIVEEGKWKINPYTYKVME